jgi:hypothetical protein
MYFIFNKYKQKIFNLSTFKDIYKEKIMKKEILSEIDQMKYLFGYKAGKVISEQTKPLNQDTKNINLIKEVVRNLSEGKFLFMSKENPGFLITSVSKEPEGRDGQDVEITFRMFGPYNQVVGDYHKRTRLSANPSKKMETPDLGNLDWKQLNELLNKGNIGVAKKTDGTLWIIDDFPPDNSPLHTLYIMAISSGGTINDEKRKNVIDYLKSIEPKSGEWILNGLYKNDKEEWTQLNNLLNQQQVK